jgi:hypothetical protein
MKKKKKKSRDGVASANKTNYARIVILASAGIALILGDFFCLPMLMPKPIIFARVIHGELISPPPVINSAPPVIVTPAQPVRTYAGMAGPPGGSEANYGPLETVNGYLQVGFDRLACFQVFVHHRMVDPVRFTSVPYLSRPIPDFIKSLDNHEIALRGFMLPLKLGNGRVTEFLIMRNRSMCCFGKPLHVNEWVHVRMNGDGVKSIMDQPLTVYGTLHVGEIVKDGQMSSIYQLDGEKMDEPTALQ